MSIGQSGVNVWTSLLKPYFPRPLIRYSTPCNDGNNTTGGWRCNSNRSSPSTQSPQPGESKRLAVFQILHVCQDSDVSLGCVGGCCNCVSMVMLCDPPSLFYSWLEIGDLLAQFAFVEFGDVFTGPDDCNALFHGLCDSVVQKTHLVASLFFWGSVSGNVSSAFDWSIILDKSIVVTNWIALDVWFKKVSLCL